MTEKLLLGTEEVVDLPEFGLYDLPSKVDTGAMTSSIHCQRIIEKEVGDKMLIKIQLASEKHYEAHQKWLEFEHYEVRNIRSSNGQAQDRYIVKTKIILYGKEFKIDLSLADRSKMNFPLLLGARFLKGKFLVDVSKKNLSQKSKV